MCVFVCMCSARVCACMCMPECMYVFISNLSIQVAYVFLCLFSYLCAHVPKHKERVLQEVSL